MVRYEYVDNPKQLAALCDAAAASQQIAWDTEFVSEYTYRPELCLIQVAAGGKLWIVDVPAAGDLSDFWNLLTSPGRENIVHAGREEMRFCLSAVGRMPDALIDVQIAAGLVGLEYPASYGTLVNRLLSKTLGKGETRTDWRVRPLASRQLEYAAQDVAYLEPLRDALYRRLDKLGRRDWLTVEMQAWQRQVEQADDQERWRRLSGMSNLPPRSLAIVRELWRWRDSEAQRRDIPPRRVLRDDLVIELARRQTSDVQRIRSVRGLVRRDLKEQLPAMAQAIQRALESPESDLPRSRPRESGPSLTLLGQFLNTTLSSACQLAQVAPGLVGTVQDVRDLVAYHLGLAGAGDSPPSLACGWRAEVVGRLIEDLVEGRLSVRVADPLADQPLAFEPREPR